jgi:hypothetical protein
MPFQVSSMPFETATMPFPVNTMASRFETPWFQFRTMPIRSKTACCQPSQTVTRASAVIESEMSRFSRPDYAASREPSFVGWGSPHRFATSLRPMTGLPICRW